MTLHVPMLGGAPFGIMEELDQARSGDCFLPDGRVMDRNGNLVRHWRTHIEDVGRVNPKKLSDLSLVEAQRHRVQQIRDKFFDESFSPVFDKIKELGIAYARDWTREMRWVEYSSSSGIGVSTDYPSATPRKPKNMDEGQEYFEVERRLSTIRERFRRFDRLFMVVLKKFLRDEVYKPDHNGQIMDLQINGRSYVFIAKTDWNPMSSWWEWEPAGNFENGVRVERIA